METQLERASFITERAKHLNGKALSEQTVRFRLCRELPMEPTEHFFLQELRANDL